ncbi:pectin lyase fold domain-containing protein [Rhizobium phage RHph_Y1_11]|nr:pectin lyase fold domain-containing protein [Rhizobium phage RHph_Y1_11]
MVANITSKVASGTTVTISGTATPGKIVRGKIGTTDYSTTADVSGNWTATVNNLPVGVVNVSAREFGSASVLVRKQMEISLARLKNTGNTTQNTLLPTFYTNLALLEGGVVQDRLIIFEYRKSGDTEWLIDGTELTDSSGNATHLFTNTLSDGNWQVRTRAGTLSGGFIEVIGNTISFLVDKPNEAPVMPPSYDKWIDGKAEGKYGYMGYMIIAQGSASGTEFGKILPLNTPKPAATFSIPASSDFAINSSTGMITLINSSLAAGTYYVTVTASNSAGSANITVPLIVTGIVSKVYYVDFDNGLDTNDGRTPAVPLKTLSAANNKRGSDIFSTYTLRFKRGVVWDITSATAPRNLTNYECYGDPSKDPPHFRNMNTGGGIFVYSGASGQINTINMRDLMLTASLTAIDVQNWLTGNIVRIKFGVNAEFGHAMYLHDARGISILHCYVPPGINGDGFYLRKFGRGATPNRVSFCYFGIPYGTGADNLQITSERKSGMQPSNVEVSDNIFRHSVASNATKGNCVIEDGDRVVFERNDCIGNYFCLSQLSRNVTVRDNILRGAILNDNSFGIGSGALDHTIDCRILFNKIEGNWTAIALSGFDDPDTPPGWQRADYEILYNMTRKNKVFAKQDRPASGFIQDNVSEQNNSNSISGNGGAAQAFTVWSTTYTPDYASFTRGSNPVNTTATTDPSTAPSISGTVSVGQTLTVTVPPIGGATSAVQWLLNDQKVVGETGLTYIVPSGAPNNANMPTNLNTPTISCAVIYTMSDGSTLIVPARYDDGKATRMIS